MKGLSGDMDSVTVNRQRSQAEADALMQKALEQIRASVRRQPPVHRHECACGDYFVCTQSNRDFCPPPDWQCPACELKAMDEFFQQSEEAGRADHRKGK